MNIFSARKFSFLLIAIVLCTVVCGCGSQAKDAAIGKPVELNTTIGDLTKLYESGAVAVRGNGIVAGLPGTGSAECPPKLREELKKYILKMTAGADIGSPDSFINSPDTAVVELYGVIPTLGAKGEAFDLRVAPMPNTQTTDLAGGRLFTTELVARDRFFDYGQYSKTLAVASGPIFVNKVKGDSGKIGDAYILAGGKIVEDVGIRLILNESSYSTASLIRNRINERFGSRTATAPSPMEIRLTIPPQYARQKEKFLEMVQVLYLSARGTQEKSRIASLINELATSKNKKLSEISLETIGKNSLNQLAGLLEHNNAEVRFRAARCMLNIGDERGMRTLNGIVKDRKSPYRINAIEAIGRRARKSDVSSVLMGVLDDDDFDVVFAAYRQLRTVGDVTVSSRVVGGDVIIDSVISDSPKRILAYRHGVPRIVIFGAPLYCSRNMFVQSADGKIMINSRPTDEFVTLSRKHPKQERLIGPIRSSHNIKEVIRALGEVSSVSNKSLIRPGLGVPYSDVISLLENMCETGVIDAEFIAGKIADFPGLRKPDTNVEAEKKIVK